MASQEHLALMMANDDSSTSSSSDDDDQGPEGARAKDVKSQEHEDLPTVVAAQVQPDVSAAVVGDLAPPGVKGQEESVPPFKKRQLSPTDPQKDPPGSAPKKKRIKLSLTPPTTTRIRLGGQETKDTAMVGDHLGAESASVAAEASAPPSSKNKAKRKRTTIRLTAPLPTTTSSNGATKKRQSRSLPMAAAAATSSDLATKQPRRASSSSSMLTQAVRRRPMRLPPALGSPGLLIPIPYMGNLPIQGDDASSNYPVPNARGVATPSSIFDYATRRQGYHHDTDGTTDKEQRHRGSSTKRTVDDLFDSQVQGPAQFLTSLLLDDDNEEASENGNDKTALWAEAFATAVHETKKERLSQEHQTTTGVNGSGIKVAPLPTPLDLIPISLTMPYPESFLQQQSQYWQLVEEREQAIVAYQQAEEKLEMEHERLFMQGNIAEDDPIPPKPDVPIPPIPDPPKAPTLEELRTVQAAMSDKQRIRTDLIAQDQEYDNADPEKQSLDGHVRKDQVGLVSHLDRSCFHLTQGRYFGLSSNSVADPNFVGPLAPGVGGLTMTSGLATVGSGAASQSGLISSVFSRRPIASTASSKVKASSSSQVVTNSTNQCNPPSSQKRSTMPTPKSITQSTIEAGALTKLDPPSASPANGGTNGQSNKQEIGQVYPEAGSSETNGTSGQTKPEISKGYPAQSDKSMGMNNLVDHAFKERSEGN